MKRVEISPRTMAKIGRLLPGSAVLLVFDERADTLPQFYSDKLARIMDGKEAGELDSNLLMGMCFARFFNDKGFRDICLGLMHQDLASFEQQDRATLQ